MIDQSVLIDILIHVLVDRYLGDNQITATADTDFCELAAIQELYLEGNALTEETIHEETFKCIDTLVTLWVRFMWLNDLIKTNLICVDFEFEVGFRICAGWDSIHGVLGSCALSWQFYLVLSGASIYFYTRPRFLAFVYVV